MPERFDPEQPAYISLRKIVAEQRQRLLAWVGSGVSADAGIPTWPQLENSLFEALDAIASGLNRDGRKRMAALAAEARASDDPWLRFQLLERAVGKTTFRDTVLLAMEPAERLQHPAVYDDLWRTGIKAMLTLNIDRFAVQSLTAHMASGAPLEFSGFDVGKLRRHLAGPRPLVANLHGSVDETKSWVFTRQTLKSLTSQEDYRSFIDGCLSTFSVIFVGITVDDVAVGGHLERLAHLGVDSPTHFWITPDREYNRNKWAESVGIRVIRYRTDGTDHSGLGELFVDLQNYVSKDDSHPSPVSLKIELADDEAAASAVLPPEEMLMQQPADTVRRVLNVHAHKLLSEDSQEAYDAFDAFAADYEEAIHKSWFVSPRPPKNRLLDYSLVDRHANGAFGTVYRAVDADGTQVAVKVLREEVRQDARALRAFRRGVQSMRLLGQENVPGVVRYIAASEIPAFVVMDWIEGANLAEAKRASKLSDWHSVLDVSRQLVSIVRGGHVSPAGVLHRDMRPSNVMLEDFWQDTERRKVVVLDFDLSWHVGANDRSVIQDTALGYLAPEQTLVTPDRSSTRSALVDSFGIGMTLYYLASGRDPIPAQHRHRDWLQDVGNAVSELGMPAWRSLPSRFMRLIVAMTDDTQSRRPDLTEVEQELQSLIIALQSPDRVNAEFVTEELAARSHSLRDYEWERDGATAKRRSTSGLTVTLSTDFDREAVQLRLSFDSTGDQDRAKLPRQISKAVKSGTERLNSKGWRVTHSTTEYGSGNLTATVDARQALAHMGVTVTLIDSIVDDFSFN